MREFKVEVIMATYSSTTDGLNTLARRVPPKRADECLWHLLNLRADDQKHKAEFVEKFQDLLPRNLFFGKQHGEPLVIPQDRSVLIQRAQHGLAYAWRGPTTLVREVSVLRLIGLYMHYEPEPPGIDLFPRGQKTEYRMWLADQSVDGFVLVLLRALHIVEQMRYCTNPTCPTPYFIAKKRRQKYCSEDCALPAQREFKRAWWDAHGDAWRKARKASAKRKLQRKRGK
jgi:hypothetical protein